MQPIKIVAFSTVQVGSVAINGTTNKITGIQAGDLSASSTDAVNGSQLFATNQNVTTAQNAANTAQATADKGLGFAVNGECGRQTCIGRYCQLC